MSAEMGGQAVLRAQPVCDFTPLSRFLLLRPFCWVLAGHLREREEGLVWIMKIPTDVFTKQFLWFPCGIVRGALAGLGITATVQAESTELPAAIFQIKTIPAKGS